MLTLFFGPDKVVDFASAQKSDTRLFAKYFKLMLDEGIYLAPSQFEAAFISATHSDADIDATLAAATKAFSEL